MLAFFVWGGAWAGGRSGGVKGGGAVAKPWGGAHGSRDC